jgi:Sec-independent protein translocase protein TatA
VAFLWNLGFSEIAVVLIVAVLIFGKRLPQVAGDAVRQVAKLRRHLDTLRRESGIDREIFDVKRTFHDLGRDIDVPPTPRRPSGAPGGWRERREAAAGAPAEGADAAASDAPRALSDPGAPKPGESPPASTPSAATPDPDAPSASGRPAPGDEAR